MFYSPIYLILERVDGKPNFTGKGANVLVFIMPVGGYVIDKSASNIRLVPAAFF